MNSKPKSLKPLKWLIPKKTIPIETHKLLFCRMAVCAFYRSIVRWFFTKIKNQPFLLCKIPIKYGMSVMDPIFWHLVSIVISGEGNRKELFVGTQGVGIKAFP